MPKVYRMLRRLLVVVLLLALRPEPASAASAKKIAGDASAALQQLYATTPAAKVLGSQAKAILVFPRILKAGFMVGAQGGNGALRKGGKTVAYYNTVAASYGFQAGVQAFSYALFLMTDSAVEYLDHSGGWELGTGPSLVVADVGAAKSPAGRGRDRAATARVRRPRRLRPLPSHGGRGLEGLPARARDAAGHPGDRARQLRRRDRHVRRRDIDLLPQGRPLLRTHRRPGRRPRRLRGQVHLRRLPAAAVPRPVPGRPDASALDRLGRETAASGRRALVSSVSRRAHRPSRSTALDAPP